MIATPRSLNVESPDRTDLNQLFWRSLWDKYFLPFPSRHLLSNFHHVSFAFLCFFPVPVCSLHYCLVPSLSEFLCFFPVPVSSLHYCLVPSLPEFLCFFPVPARSLHYCLVPVPVRVFMFFPCSCLFPPSLSCSRPCPSNIFP